MLHRTNEIVKDFFLIFYYTNSMHENIYWLGFSVFPGIGPLRFQKLLKRFDSAKKAWEAAEKDVVGVLGEQLTRKFFMFKKNFSLTAYEKRLADKKISCLFLKDTTYPSLLSEIPGAPFVLYCKGDAALVSAMTRGLAVVGTRKISRYGEEVTKLLTKQLLAQQFVIISGLALGVDAVAHQTAIAYNGKTIAVLGCGVDCCVPGSNLTIYDKIVRQFGAVISESAFGNTVSKGMFPSRNRIIAGLSQGVLVTEGAEDSGALITAQRALEFGRPVFAVPGPITSPLSKGPLKLLQKGARLVQSGEDVLAALQMQRLGRDIRQMADVVFTGVSDVPEEQEILDILTNGSMYLDEIVRKLEKDSATVGSLLSILEIKGMVKSGGGKFSV